jgi:hypothetical protein
MRLFGTLGAAGLIAAAVFLFGAQPSQAKEYPWCAQYDATTYNCGFETYYQCLATISGIGGICIRNPRYVVYTPQHPQPSYVPPRY